MAKPRFVLPTERNQVTKRWQDQTFLTIGISKWGKSELWAEDQEPLFIETEPGLGYLTPYKLTVRSWDEFLEVGGLLINTFASEGKLPYTSLTIDTIDKLYDYCADNEVVLAKKRMPQIADRITTIGEIPEGAGWQRASKELKGKLDKLADLPLAVNLIGHTKESRKTGKETVNVSGQAGSAVVHWANHIMFCQTIKSNRYIYARTNDLYEAGSRGMMLPETMTMQNGDRDNPDSIKEAAQANFQQIRRCFE